MENLINRKTVEVTNGRDDIGLQEVTLERAMTARNFIYAVLEEYPEEFGFVKGFLENGYELGNMVKYDRGNIDNFRSDCGQFYDHVVKKVTAQECYGRVDYAVTVAVKSIEEELEEEEEKNWKENHDRELEVLKERFAKVVAENHILKQSLFLGIDRRAHDVAQIMLALSLTNGDFITNEHLERDIKYYIDAYQTALKMLDKSGGEDSESS